MGQGRSKQHSPLTFGYVDYSRTPYLIEKADVDTSSGGTYDNMSTDYVLNHPELYKLEVTCKCIRSITSNNCSAIVSANNDFNEEGIVATQQYHRQAKRTSFICNHLAKDLEYIDETYYADIKRCGYISGDKITALTDRKQQLSTPTTDNRDYYNYFTGSRNDGDNDDDVDINENWGKVTVGEITSQTARHMMGTPNTADNQYGDPAATFTAQSKTLTLDLSGRYLVKLSSGIGYLSTLTKLNLSNNQLSALPKSIGYLANLTILNISHNQLETLPDTMTHLVKLKAINTCHNNLTHLPPCLGFLPELIIIIANNNQIRRIPNEIANLQQMITFNISNNPLPCLPAEIANIKSLRKLIAEGCQFRTEFSNKWDHDPPTLLEQCARTIVQHQLTLPNQLPDHLRSYLSSHQACSYCHGPYFESFATRHRIIERVSQQPIALEYRLCRAHWSDDEDRLLNLFSTPPSAADQSSCYPGGDKCSSAMTGTSSIHSSTMSSSADAQKRSGSGSSNVSSSYRTLPTLPSLPRLNTYSGNSNLPPLSTTTSICHEQQLNEQCQQRQQNIRRQRANSFTKRVTRVLSLSNSSNRSDSNSNFARSTQTCSSLRQEINAINSTISTASSRKENEILESTRSPGDEQSIYPHQHVASSSFCADDSNHQTRSEQQHHLLHRTRTEISPSVVIHGEEQQQSSPWKDCDRNTATDHDSNGANGTNMGQRNILPTSQPTLLHASLT